jgi:hypothetical protein
MAGTKFTLILNLLVSTWEPLRQLFAPNPDKCDQKATSHIRHIALMMETFLRPNPFKMSYLVTIAKKLMFKSIPRPPTNRQATCGCLSFCSSCLSGHQDSSYKKEKTYFLSSHSSGSFMFLVHNVWPIRSFIRMCYFSKFFLSTSNSSRKP